MEKYKNKKNKFNMHRILGYLLAVCICIGGIPIAYALGDEQHVASKTLLTYNDAGTEVDVFEPSEEFNEVWSLGVEKAAEQLSEEGYENLEAANEKDLMIYVSKDRLSEENNYIKASTNEMYNMEIEGLERYDGLGGEYYVWRMFNGSKTDNIESDEKKIDDGQEENVRNESAECFWICTDVPVDLEVVHVQDSEQESNVQDTEEFNIQTENEEVPKTQIEETEDIITEASTENNIQNIDTMQVSESHELDEVKVKKEYKKSVGFIVNSNKYNVYQKMDNVLEYVGGANNWNDIIRVLNADRTNSSDGEYAIDLHNGDLTPPADWSAQLTGANAAPATQWNLTFYSTGSTGDGTTKYTLNLPNRSKLGAHVTIHGNAVDGFGCNLKTPTRASNTYGAAFDNYIQANGWSFVVEKEVDVTGNATVFGAIDASQYDGRKLMRYINADGLPSTNIEIYSGTWFFIAGGIGRHHGYTETNVIVGSPDDTESDHVTVEGAVVATGLATGDHIIWSQAVEGCKVSGYNALIQGYTEVGVVAGTFANHLRGVEERKNTPNMNITIKDHVKVTGVGTTYTGNGFAMGIAVAGGDIYSDNAWWNYKYKFDVNLTIQDDVEIANGVAATSPNAFLEGIEGSTGNLTITGRVKIGGNLFSGAALTDVVRMSQLNVVIKGTGKGEDGIQINGSVFAFSAGERFEGFADGSEGKNYITLTFQMENTTVGGNIHGFVDFYDAYIQYVNSLSMDIKNSIVKGSVFGYSSDDQIGYLKEGIAVNISDSTVGGAFLFGATGLDADKSANKISGGNNTLTINNSSITSTILGVKGRDTDGLWKTYGKNAVNGKAPTYNISEGTFDSITPYDIPRTKMSVGVYESATITATNSYASPYGKGGDTNTINVSNVIFTGNDTAQGIAIGGIGATNYSNETGNNITLNISDIKNSSNLPIDIIGCGRILNNYTAVNIPSLTINLENIEADANLDRIMFSGGSNQYLLSQKMINMKNVTAKYIVAHGNDAANNTYNKTVQNAIGKTAVLYLNGSNIIGVEGNAQSGIEAANLNVNIKGIADAKASERDLYNIINGKFVISGTNSTDGAGVLQMEGGELRLGNTGAAGQVSDRLVGSIVNTSKESKLYIYKSEGTGHNNTYPLSVAVNGGMKSSEKLKLGEWNEKNALTVMGDIFLNFRTKSKADETQYNNMLVYPHKIGKDSMGNIVLGERIGYQVVYGFNGGTGGIPLTETYEEGVVVTVSESSDMIPPTDKVFDYWESSIAVDANGTSTTKLNPKDTFVMPAQDITLKAIWKDVKKDITFDGFDGGNALIKVKNSAGITSSKALPKVKINGAYASAEEMKKFSYSFERFVRTGTSGNYSYGWSGTILKEGQDDAEIKKLPVSVIKPEGEKTEIRAGAKAGQAGIVRVTITYDGNEKNQASCIVFISGDVDMNGTVRVGDSSIITEYLLGTGTTLDLYEYMEIMADMNSEALSGNRITIQDLEMLEEILNN